MVIDQQQLPFRFEIKQLTTAADAAEAIANMVVRGAPLIGATAACGLLLATAEDPSDEHLLNCLLYTSPSPRDGLLSRMPSSA